MIWTTARITERLEENNFKCAQPAYLSASQLGSASSRSAFGGPQGACLHSAPDRRYPTITRTRQPSALRLMDFLSPAADCHKQQRQVTKKRSFFLLRSWSFSSPKVHQVTKTSPARFPLFCTQQLEMQRNEKGYWWVSYELLMRSLFACR